MLERSTARGAAPSLVGTVLTGVLLPIGAALLPLATTGLAGREPYGFTMFWGAPENLLYLGFLGGMTGLAIFFVRNVAAGAQKPGWWLRVVFGVAGLAFTPLPALLDPDAVGAYATLFLAPNWIALGVAFAWRVRQWAPLLRQVVTAAVVLVAGEFVVGMLRHAPPDLAALRWIALPVAFLSIVAKLWAMMRPDRS